MSLGPGAPGMTLNLGGGNYSDKIEEQMENEQEEERQQLRAVLEAEMNDDDLFSDEEDDEEYQQDVELHTTDDLTQKIHGDLKTNQKF